MVLKESSTELLFKSIRVVMAGQYWVGRDTVSDLVKMCNRLQGTDAQPAAGKFGLTRRELSVVPLVVAGYANKDIAEKLDLSTDFRRPDNRHGNIKSTASVELHEKRRSSFAPAGARSRDGRLPHSTARRIGLCARRGKVIDTSWPLTATEALPRTKWR